MIDVEWIAIDWGTSSLRAWAMNAAGEAIHHAASEDGMVKLTPSEFEPALLKLIAPWLPATTAKPIPAIACGMVGAKQGWQEAVYRANPCAPLGTPFTSSHTADPRLSVHIIPGLSQSEPADVMRGEETQIAGVLHANPDFDGVLCLPGTHTKWAWVSNGQVSSFLTFMTGELFGLLSRQSVLRHSMAGDDWSEDAFKQGVDDALADPTWFAAELFTLRAASLLHSMDAGTARARLSGLLIGVELSAAASFWRMEHVAIVGSPKIAAPYATALAAQGIHPDILDAEHITLDGLRAAYKLYRETTSK